MSYRSIFMIYLSRSTFWDSEPTRQRPIIIYISGSTKTSRSWQPNISQQFKNLLFVAFRSAGQLSLSWATLVQSTPPSYFFKMQFSISYQCLWVPSSFLPSGFPIKPCTHLSLTHTLLKNQALYFILHWTKHDVSNIPETLDNVQHDYRISTTAINVHTRIRI